MFFLLEGYALWSVLGVLALCTLATMDCENSAGCSLFIIATLVVLEFFTNIKPIAWSIQNPKDAAALVAIYVFVGAVWIVVKWVSYVYSIRRTFLTIKDDIVKNVLKIPTNNYYTTVDGQQILTESGMKLVYYNAASALGVTTLPLRVYDHKSTLYMWWVCWPLSLVWTIINDPIKRTWHFIYDLVANLLQNISNAAFKL